MPRTESDITVMCVYNHGRNGWKAEIRCETDELAKRFARAAEDSLSSCAVDHRTNTVIISGVGIADRNRAIYFAGGFEAALKY